MNRLVIVGAGGFGREVHSWVKSSPEWTRASTIDEIVFVDDSAPSIAVPAPVVSTVEDYRADAYDLVICAIGSPRVRKSVVTKLVDRGARFVSFVHDRAILGERIDLGTGAVICPTAVLSSDIRIGEHVHINTGSNIGHDVTIGEFVTLSSACNLTGAVSVEDGAFLATAVTVIPGKRIGSGAYVGVGSVVLKDVPPHTTVFGNPSRIIGKSAA